MTHSTPAIPTAPQKLDLQMIVGGASLLFIALVLFVGVFAAAITAYREYTSLVDLKARQTSLREGLTSDLTTIAAAAGLQTIALDEAKDAISQKTTEARLETDLTAVKNAFEGKPLDIRTTQTGSKILTEDVMEISQGITVSGELSVLLSAVDEAAFDATPIDRVEITANPYRPSSLGSLTVHLRRRAQTEAEQ